MRSRVRYVLILGISLFWSLGSLTVSSQGSASVSSTLDPVTTGPTLDCDSPRPLACRPGEGRD